MRLVCVAELESEAIAIAHLSEHLATALAPWKHARAREIRVKYFMFDAMIGNAGWMEVNNGFLRDMKRQTDEEREEEERDRSKQVNTRFPRREGT
jgi:hypothetical protein